MCTCLMVHISCLLPSLTSSRFFSSLDNLSSKLRRIRWDPECR
jgi:hypothetical protein